MCDEHSDFIASCELESSPAISRSAVLIGCFSSTIDSKHELNPSLWKTHTDVLGRKVPIVCEIRYSTNCQSSPNSQSCCVCASSTLLEHTVLGYKSFRRENSKMGSLKVFVHEEYMKLNLSHCSTSEHKTTNNAMAKRRQNHHEKEEDLQNATTNLNTAQESQDLLMSALSNI